MITMTQTTMRPYTCILNPENESSLLLSLTSASSSRCSSPLEAPEKLSDRVLSHFILPRSADVCLSDLDTMAMTECFSADESSLYQPPAADDELLSRPGAGCYATPASPGDDHAASSSGADNVNNHEQHHEQQQQLSGVEDLMTEEQHHCDETEQRPSTHHSTGNGADHEAAEPDPPRCKCEYVSECSLNAGDANAPLRKCVSHIFGRNKSCTRTIPNHLWVWYCRKHYQRVKYRQGDWVMKQCELIMETLRRLREWNGVEAYHISRRKREQKRAQGVSGRANPNHSGPSSTNATTTTNNNNTNNTNTTGGEGVSTKKKAKRSPVNKPSPIVSEKIQQFLDKTLSLDETDAFVHMIYEDLKERIKHDQETYHKEESDRKKRRDAKQRLREVTFPDLEILPLFKESVEARATVNRAKNSNKVGLRRVNKKGGVKKLTAP